jgi:Ca2+-binding RTX toxin-like protein
VGILLTDAETGLDPSNPTVRAFRASGNAITGNGYGFFNADILNASVRLGASASAPGNWWGCATGPPASGCNSVSGVDTASAPSVELGTPLASAPPPLAVPAPTPDLPPAGSFVDPAEGDEVAIGETVTPTVFTSDDFGVKSVAVTLDGNPFATGGHTPYEFSWTPTIADIGTRTFAATITDSSGHTTVVSRRLVVPAPPGYVAATLDPLSWNAGTILIGFATTRSFTLTNTGQNPVAIGSIALTGDATFAISGGSCAAPSTLAIGASCTIVVRFAPAGEGPRVGALSVGYVAPGSTGPLVATLTGSGHIVPVLAIPGAGPGAAVPPPAAPMCEGHTATIVAAPGQTSIIGTPGSDVIIGTAAADTIDGRGGNDTICAGAGADTVRGARGNDLIRGGSGNDRLSGDAGDDVLLGGAGADDLRGGSGNDRTGGGDGNDRVDGGSGNDVLDEMKLSGRGKDRLFGGTGNDRIRTAGSTKDQVDCGSGRDFVLVDRFDKHVHCESVTHA